MGKTRLIEQFTDQAGRAGAVVAAGAAPLAALLVGLRLLAAGHTNREIGQRL
ncbi:MAG TPA: hypothetical protein VKP11_00735 [Frankiaceae bacterium]|nr:hypothetical protein [Frankiaceae bacterium]